MALEPAAIVASALEGGHPPNACRVTIDRRQKAHLEQPERASHHPAVQRQLRYAARVIGEVRSNAVSSKPAKERKPRLPPRSSSSAISTASIRFIVRHRSGRRVCHFDQREDEDAEDPAPDESVIRARWLN